MIVRVFVMGIDPGLSRCGYCVLERLSARSTAVRALGVFRTPTDQAVPQRLAILQDDVSELITEFAPAVVAIERVLFQVNVQTAMAVGQASGVVMALAVRHGAEVVEYSPNEVKQVVTGSGSADKAQVQMMVQRLLKLKSLPEPADAADAAAVALTHLASATMRSLAQAGTR